MRKYRYLITVVVIALDQLVKYIIRSGMQVGESVAVINGIFHITYVRNFGVAFSLLKNMTAVISGCMAVVIIIAIVVIEKNKEAHVLLPMSLSLVIAGGAGNLIDRIAFGFVTDMFDFRIWPVFNVADIAVCVGLGLLVIFVFAEDKREKAKKAAQVKEAEEVKE